ncbi:MAG: sulfotransferase [Pararhodobacter sp.]|nr:sulfotransferase [Pararhodobacter sp.]
MGQSATNQPVWPEGVRLLLGIGAQKSGTSWVFRYLRGHPACRVGPMKELHYFDTIAGLGNAGSMVQARKLRRLSKRQQPDMLAAVARLRAICETPDANHQSYVDLVTEGLAPGQVALDITPSYSALGIDSFRQMAALQGARFLFLMREPVARLWSSVRMQMSKKVENPADFEPACQERLDLMLELDRAREFTRADYTGTLSRLEQCVPAGRRLVMFCEDLFTQSAADRICDFLEIAPHPLADLGVVNEGLQARMRADQETALAARLRPQYEAICAAFGEKVPQSWHARFAAQNQRVTA